MFWCSLAHHQPTPALADKGKRSRRELSKNQTVEGQNPATPQNKSPLTPSFNIEIRQVAPTDFFLCDRCSCGLPILSERGEGERCLKTLQDYVLQLSVYFLISHVFSEILHHLPTQPTPSSVGTPAPRECHTIASRLPHDCHTIATGNLHMKWRAQDPGLWFTHNTPAPWSVKVQFHV